MKYIFKGRLCGFICAECPEPLSNVKVRIYRIEDQENIVSNAVSNAKETFTIVNEEAIKAKEARSIAEADTDEEGNFSFELGENKKYGGEAFEIDVYCGTVPHLKPGKNPPPPVQFSITTLQPRWRETNEGLLFVYNYCLPFRFWCAIRARFNAWTICGRLRTCAAPQTPIAGATVRAFDADWLQDDSLGSAVTDATGRFRIDYTTADFRVTPFSPFINIEFASGPDVYFKAELGGITIIDETQTDGRQPGRENVGHCFCVELCSDQVQPTDPEEIPHWNQVEIFNIHPFPSGSTTGFSAEGYAGGPANSFVFGGGVTLKGNCSLRNVAAPANPLEYRFLIGEWTWTGGADDPNSLPTVAPAILNPVTQIAQTQVGTLYYGNAFALPGEKNDQVKVYINAPDLQAGGWIKIDGKAVDNVNMRDGTTATFNINKSNFTRTFDLFELNSPAITSAHPAKLPGGLPIADAGRSLNTNEREPIRRYRLMFEVRDSVTLTPVATRYSGFDCA